MPPTTDALRLARRYPLAFAGAVGGVGLLAVLVVSRGSSGEAITATESAVDVLGTDSVGIGPLGGSPYGYPGGGYDPFGPSTYPGDYPLPADPPPASATGCSSPKPTVPTDYAATYEYLCSAGQWWLVPRPVVPTQPPTQPPPPPGVPTSVRRHTVVSGDTLIRIANRYGTTVNAILAANQRTYPTMTRSYIRIGWVLVIP